MGMLSTLVCALALGPIAASAGCSSTVHARSECAGESYLTKHVSSSDECSSACCDDDRCVQWTFRWHLLGGTCALADRHLAIATGLPYALRTCGLRSAPPGPAPAPPGPPTGAQRWAVIAVGSKGYYNYRHQADGCHAYGLMLKSGIPASNIILMMQDDVARSSMNPFKGELYNRPDRGGVEPPNVYEGCKPDYTGDIVTAKLFLSVIAGDEAAVDGGKVLKSGPEDHVFLNFIDHGGPGIVAFPNGPVLHKSQLVNGLQAMKENHMFKELVFYMEACESGSMFDKSMPSPGSGMYAVTASNAKESSWGFYCSSKDTVKSRQLHTCLGDLFSIAWMEDTDRGHWASEKISDQVKLVTKRTNLSHVTQFGDMAVASEAIGKFELNSDIGTPAEFEASVMSAVGVRDIPLHLSYLKWQAQTEETAKVATWREYSRVQQAREADKLMFAGIVSQACDGDETCKQTVGTLKHNLVDERCHKALVDVVYESCPRRSEEDAGGWNAFNMQFSQILVNLCEMKGELGHSVTELEDVARAQCRGAAGRVAHSLLV